MPFEIVRNDITRMRVDAIVNTANPKPVIGYGADAGIHQAAGPKLLEARKVIGNIPVGQVAMTPGFDLPAKYVIHAVGPVWQGGNQNEEALLRACYTRSLDLAKARGLESIAFPLMSAGNHGFPKSLALQIAVNAISAFLMENDIQIYLVVFSRSAFQLSEKLFRDVSSFIDERYIRKATLKQYGVADKCSVPGAQQSQILREQKRRRQAEVADVLCESAIMPSAPPPCPNDLSRFLQKKDAGFVETLLELIQQRGLKNSAVYKRANISKQHFSKLINNPNAAITKPVAVALALALELDLKQTQDLIQRAGYALTNSSIFDLIIQYHIENKIYNVVEINIVLYEFDQMLLGA